MQKLLSQLLPAFDHQSVAADGATLVADADIANISISNLVFDSREVTKVALYFAMPGTHIKVNEFIHYTIQKVSNAILF